MHLFCITFSVCYQGHDLDTEFNHPQLFTAVFHAAPIFRKYFQRVVVVSMGHVKSRLKSPFRSPIHKKQHQLVFLLLVIGAIRF